MTAKNSFEGIGQWAATFACSGVQAGQTVKISGGGSVASCAAGEDFCGVVLAVGRDGGACSVALGGLVTVPYSGTAPALGWSALAADGKGGVKAAGGEAAGGGTAGGESSAQTAENGRKYLVADVDETGKTVTFVL